MSWIRVWVPDTHLGTAAEATPPCTGQDCTEALGLWDTSVRASP